MSLTVLAFFMSFKESTDLWAFNIALCVQQPCVFKWVLSAVCSVVCCIYFLFSSVCLSVLVAFYSTLEAIAR